MRRAARPVHPDARMQGRRRTGLPPMRPALVRLPRTTSAPGRSRTSFLFGPDVLVAPITELGTRSRHVYLPAGAKLAGHSDPPAVLSGGEGHFVEAPLETDSRVRARRLGNRPSLKSFLPRL